MEETEKEPAVGRTTHAREEVIRAPNASHRRGLRIRPLSWLPFSRPPPQDHCSRSQSVQLPKATSTSTVARSVISAPVLTSTTNVGVARAEGVHCGEISDLTFSQSTWNSQVGWVATSTGVPAERQPGPDTPGLGPPAGRIPAGGRETPSNKAPSRRERVFRLGYAVRNKIKGGPLWKPVGRRLESHSSSPREDTHDRTTGDATENGPAHRGAEKLNLYKGKIRGLTGHAHIRRKSLSSAKDLAETNRDPPLLGDFTGKQVVDASTEQSDGDSAFGSLTRSFASAVDKLDFHSPGPRNVSFLRSKSSFFHTRKTDTDTVERTEPKQRLPAVSTPQTLLSTNMPTPQPLRPAPLPPGPRGTMASDPVAEAGPAPGRSTPSPMVFSTEKNAYIPAKPAPGYPRGVNPLRMHPPDTFASPPSPGSGPQPSNPTSGNSLVASSHQQVQDPSRPSEDDNESVSLEDAPIYSPSLGDLSQYARDTPRSTRPSHHETPRSNAMEATPTRPAMKNSGANEGHRGLLKKSRSGVGLFSRAKASKGTSNGGGNGGDHSRLASTSTLSPLYERDANRKLDTDSGNSVKKSRSLHFGGLFRKESQSSLSLSTPVPRDMTSPFQPATPSPLRNVTRARGADVSRDDARSSVRESPSLFHSPRK